MEEQRYWSDNDKAIAKKIERKGSALAYIHEHAAGDFDHKDKMSHRWINILSFVFGSTGVIVPIGLIVGAVVSETNQSAIHSIVTIALGICVFILGGVGIYFQSQDYSGKNTSHARAASSYADQYLHVHTMRRRSKDRRQDFADFFADMYRRDSQTRADAGPIPESSIKAYYNAHGDKAIDRDTLFNETLDEMEEINNSPISKQLKKSIKRTKDELFQIQRYKRN